MAAAVRGDPPDLPSAAGTRLHHTCEIAPKSFLAKLMSPMVRKATQKQIKRDTAKLVVLLRPGS